MNYNLKGMFTPQPKIYNEENEENEELELLNVSSSSSSSIIPPDEPLLSDKKRCKICVLIIFIIKYIKVFIVAYYYEI